MNDPFKFLLIIALIGLSFGYPLYRLWREESIGDASKTTLLILGTLAFVLLLAALLPRWFQDAPDLPEVLP